MASSRAHQEKTSGGGEYSEMYFFDDAMSPVDEQVATRCVINEYDGNGNVIRTTYGYCNRGPSVSPKDRTLSP